MLPTAKTAQIGRNHGGAGIARSSICCAVLPGRRRQTTDRRNDTARIRRRVRLGLV